MGSQLEIEEIALEALETEKFNPKAIYKQWLEGKDIGPLTLQNAEALKGFLEQKQQRYQKALEAIDALKLGVDNTKDNVYTRLQEKLEKENELLTQYIQKNELPSESDSPAAEISLPKLESVATATPAADEKSDELPNVEALTPFDEFLTDALHLSTVAGATSLLKAENKEKTRRNPLSPENGFGDNPISEEALQEKATAYTVLLGEALKTPADLDKLLEAPQDESTAPISKVWAAYQEIKGQPENETKTDNELLVEAVDLVWARYRAVSEMIVDEARSLLDNSTTLSATDKTAAHEALNKLLPLIDKSVLLGEALEATEFKQELEKLGITKLVTWADTILNPEARAATIQKHYADLEGYNRIPGYPYLFTLKEPANANDNSLEHILARDFKDIYPNFDTAAEAALSYVTAENKERSKALLAQLAITALSYQVHTRESQETRKAKVVKEFKRQSDDLARLLGEDADTIITTIFSGSPDVSKAIEAVQGQIPTGLQRKTGNTLITTVSFLWNNYIWNRIKNWRIFRIRLFSSNRTPTTSDNTQAISSTVATTMSTLPETPESLIQKHLEWYSSQLQIKKNIQEGNLPQPNNPETNGEAGENQKATSEVVKLMEEKKVEINLLTNVEATIRKNNKSIEGDMKSVRKNNGKIPRPRVNMPDLNTYFGELLLDMKIASGTMMVKDEKHDGNCMFHALERLLKDHPKMEEADNNIEPYQKVKQLCLEYIKKDHTTIPNDNTGNSVNIIKNILLQEQVDNDTNSNSLTAYLKALLKLQHPEHGKSEVDKLFTALQQPGSEELLVKTYTDAMAEDARYGNNVILHAASKVFGVKINIFQRKNGRRVITQTFGLEEKGKTINILHLVDHYNSIVPSKNLLESRIHRNTLSKKKPSNKGMSL